ncbi:MAG: hypothetical protein ACRDMU_05380 [Gaiellaceae bacterium]
MPLRRLLVITAIVTASAALAPSAGAATAAGAEGAAAVNLDCTVASTAGCVPGRTLTLRNRKFFCNRPLARWGRLPLKVVVTFTVGRRFGANGAIDLYTGCAGDANPATVDLIVDVRGNGRSYGPGNDAFKVRRGAGYTRGIQVTGTVQCGPRYSLASHQDGVQVQGGRNITFVDFNVGRYNLGRSTCQGAGGAFFYSGGGTNIDVVRGRYIACNHSLLVGRGTGAIVRARFRSGRTDGSDPKCRSFAGSAPCDIGPGVRVSNLVCQRWNARRNVWVASRPR